MLGWNICYEFNDADFEVSENILSTYLEQYEDTPWDALRYLIAGINYGGHVTDDWDRRLLLTYINIYFCPAVLEEPFFKLSDLPWYYIPRDGSLSAYREFAGMLPSIDHPEAFGQHPNADIASQIQEARILFDTLLSLQPKVSDKVDIHLKLHVSADSFSALIKTPVHLCVCLIHLSPLSNQNRSSDKINLKGLNQMSSDSIKTRNFVLRNCIRYKLSEVFFS